MSPLIRNSSYIISVDFSGPNKKIWFQALWGYFEAQLGTALEGIRPEGDLPDPKGSSSEVQDPVVLSELFFTFVKRIQSHELYRLYVYDLFWSASCFVWVQPLFVKYMASRLTSYYPLVGQMYYIYEISKLVIVANRPHWEYRGGPFLQVHH